MGIAANSSTEKKSLITLKLVAENVEPNGEILEYALALRKRLDKKKFFSRAICCIRWNLKRVSLRSGWYLVSGIYSLGSRPILSRSAIAKESMGSVLPLGARLFLKFLIHLALKRYSLRLNSRASLLSARYSKRCQSYIEVASVPIRISDTQCSLAIL